MEEVRQCYKMHNSLWGDPAMIVMIVMKIKLIKILTWHHQTHYKILILIFKTLIFNNQTDKLILFNNRLEKLQQ